jgi:hypothetical protein
MNIVPPTPPGEADYEALEGWIMTIANGRWFLAEYAGRNRRDDTVKLLTALSRIEHVARGANNMRVNLVALHDAISKVQAAIARTKLSSDPRETADALKAAAGELEAKIVDLVVILGRDLTSSDHLLGHDRLSGLNGSSQPNQTKALTPSSGNSTERSSGREPIRWGVNSGGHEQAFPELLQHPPAAMEDLISRACHWLHAVAETSPTVVEQSQHLAR